MAIIDRTVRTEVRASKLICQSNDSKIAAETKANVRENALAPRAIGQKNFLKCRGDCNKGTLEDTNVIKVEPDTANYNPTKSNMTTFPQVFVSEIAISMVRAANTLPTENMISLAMSLPRILHTIPVDK